MEGVGGWMGREGGREWTHEENIQGKCRRVNTE